MAKPEYRASKFKNVYGNPARKDKCYEGIRVTTNAGEGTFVDANPKFIAVVLASSGGGAFMVLPLSKIGRVPTDFPRVCGHHGNILDLKWDPFNDNVIASASEDCTVKIWYIPDGEMTQDITKCLVDLHGHERKVSTVLWHPVSENILASCGYDHLIFIWNAEEAEALNRISCHPDVIYGMTFNYWGNLIATTCKDKNMRIVDPRQGKLLLKAAAHQGPKFQHIQFLGKSNRLVTTGFSRLSERQFAIWDMSDLNKPLKLISIDSCSGVLVPFFDNDTNVLYLAGKGDGNIRYYEITNNTPYATYLTEFASSTPQRSLGTMPKRGLKTADCEIYRFYKMLTNGFIEIIPMIVPRRQSSLFQDDIYPDTPSDTPALTAQEWISGQDSFPRLISLKEGTLQRQPVESVPKIDAVTSFIPGQSKIIMQEPSSAPPPEQRQEIVRTELFKREDVETTQHAPVEPVVTQYRTERSESRTERTERRTRTDSQNGPVTKVSETKINLIQRGAGPTPEQRRREMERVEAELRKEPRSEEELRRAYMDQKEQIRRLKDMLRTRDMRIEQLESELKKVVAGDAKTYC